MTRRKRKKRWSYNAGQRGRNWVRAFEKPDGSLNLEWMENGARKRRRLQNEDKEKAKAKADELAAEFLKLEEESQAPVTVARLILIYSQEVTPNKSKSKQGHDCRASRIWISFFDSQPEAERRSERKVTSLDRTDWDRFISQRIRGEIPGWAKPVKNRQVSYDLKFMIAVLNWGTGQKTRGQPLLATSPWRAEVRRSQKWKMPRELNPHRPGMTDEIRKALIAHSRSWQFGLALVLQRETRRRNSSIRQLLWSDIDLEAREVTWRRELDKSDKGSVTPLTGVAVEVLRKAPSRGIGNAPVFPAMTNPDRSTPRNTFQIWLRRSKDRWLDSVPEEEREDLKARLRGIGFHAEKRAGVRDPNFRALPPAIQEAMAGTRYETLRSVYDEVTAADIRRALQAVSSAN